MVISVSRRTDIPAFYAEWFMNRTREGYALVENPFNPAQRARVDLRPEAVEAVVFWTRNPAPLMPHLEELDRRGYRYYFLYTITGYPPMLEPGAPRPKEAVETFCALSRRVGPERILWRYDPVLVSEATPEEYILQNFEELLRVLGPFTRRVVVSFAHLYGKTVRNLTRAAVAFQDPDREARLRIARGLSRAAGGHGLPVFSCASPEDLSPHGIAPGRCIDGTLIGDVLGVRVSGEKDPSQRAACGCARSKDIGAYDTCLHGCLYCYATGDREAALGNHARHDPAAASLLPRTSHEAA
jgi:hypothetical protein